MLNGELYCTEITEVNLTAFVQRLFHEDLSSIDRTYIRPYKNASLYLYYTFIICFDPFFLLVPLWHHATGIKPLCEYKAAIKCVLGISAGNKLTQPAINHCYCNKHRGRGTARLVPTTYTAAASLNSYSASHDNWCTVGGDGDVGSARYEPALLPPCPTIRVLSYSN